ncbi:hypothetical protein ACNKHX_16915 [Shigella flexneri]
MEPLAVSTEYHVSLQNREVSVVISVLPSSPFRYCSRDFGYDEVTDSLSPPIFILIPHQCSLGSDVPFPRQLHCHS